MSALPSAPARPAPPLAGTALSLAAFVAPPLAVFAPLALAPLLALLAVAVLAAGPRAALVAARPYAALFALLALLALWAAASTLWSIVPGHSLFEALRFLAICAEGVLALGVAAALPEPRAARFGRALLAGLALSVVLLLLDRYDNDVALRAVAHLPAGLSIPLARYDRAVTVLLLLAFPGAASLALRRRWLLLAVLIAGTALAVFGSASHTCKLAFLLAVPATFVALRLPRLAARLLLLALVLAAFLLPPLLPDGPGIAAIQHRLPTLPGSAIHRLAIWRFTADAIASRPIAGWGMDASRALPGGEAPVQRYFPEIAISPNAQALPLHPHDAALQWRLELGLPGTLLALAVVALALERLGRARLRAAPRALALGYAAAALTIALLSFGIWQAWWLSTLWLSGAALTALTLPGEMPAPPGTRQR